MSRAIRHSVLRPFGKLRAQDERYSYPFGILIFSALIAATAAFALSRNATWKGEISLWADVVLKAPGNSMAHNNLGRGYFDAGMFDDAIQELRVASELGPWYVEPRNTLGLAYVRKGLFDEAEREFKEVVRIYAFLKSGHYRAMIAGTYETIARLNLGNIKLMKGDYEEAVTNYKEAILISPDDTSVRFNLAIAYKRMGRTDDARAEFEEILRLDPSDEDARRNLVILSGG